MVGLESLDKVWEVRALKRRPREAEAQRMLERAAAEVAPLMARRRWRVPLLTEFFPRSANLLGLNINGGQHIKVRLRAARAPDRLMPFDAVVGTLLHELAHIARGPHDARFYAVLQELTLECAAVVWGRAPRPRLTRRRPQGAPSSTAGIGTRAGYRQTGVTERARVEAQT